MNIIMICELVVIGLVSMVIGIWLIWRNAGALDAEADNPEHEVEHDCLPHQGMDEFAGQDQVPLKGKTMTTCDHCEEVMWTDTPVIRPVYCDTCWTAMCAAETLKYETRLDAERCRS